MGCSLCGSDAPAESLDRLLSDRQQQVRRHPMSERWMREWSQDVCEFQGLEPGTEQYELCRVEQVDDVLSNPATAQAVRASATARSLFFR